MKRILLAAVLAILAGCSPEIRVYSDYEPDYDVWTYRSFGWAETRNIEEGKNPLYYNELNDHRIKSAVQKEFAKRGYVLEKDQPDLLLHYHIIVDDRSVVTTEPFGYHYGPYWMRMRTNVYQYREGTLILDLMDTKTNNLVWRGWAVSPLNEVYSTERTEKLINVAVQKIFRKFPKTVTPSYKEKDLATKR